jgi:hypothetical protein
MEAGEEGQEKLSHDCGTVGKEDREEQLMADSIGWCWGSACGGTEACKEGQEKEIRDCTRAGKEDK